MLKTGETTSWWAFPEEAFVRSGLESECVIQITSGLANSDHLKRRISHGGVLWASFVALDWTRSLGRSTRKFLRVTGFPPGKPQPGWRSGCGEKPAPKLCWRDAFFPKSTSSFAADAPGAPTGM